MTTTTSNINAMQEEPLIRLSELERNDSETTDESPFTSALTTPVDQDAPISIYQGIHEALARDMKDIHGEAAEYFNVKTVDGKGASTLQVSLDLEEQQVVEVEIVPETTSPSVIDVPASDTPVSPLLCSELGTPLADLDELDGRMLALGIEGASAVPTSSESEDTLPRAFSTESINKDDTSSPHFSSPDLDPIPGSIYTLPNAPILVESLSTDSQNQLTVDNAYPTGLEPDIDPQVTPSPPLPDDYEPRYPDFVFHAVAMSAIRVILFLPWCVAAGATLLLCPKHLELVVFQPGYLEPQKGLHRFAHFAECGMQYSMTFLTFLISLVYVYPNLGMVITGGLLAQFLHVWQDFEADRNVPLGHDDRQMIYILATSSWLTGESVGIQKIEDQYYLSSAALKNRELDVGLEKDSDEE